MSPVMRPKFRQSSKLNKGPSAGEIRTLSSLAERAAEVPDDAVDRAQDGSHDADEKDQGEDGLKARLRLNQTKTLAIIRPGRISCCLENVKTGLEPRTSKLSLT